MIGTPLSHYRITEKLGQGGMGEVYRAEDIVLGRQVAIKVLPDIFAGDPERLARFEREAKLLASLNHPNIATIHGLEHADGKWFLVMELVEGDTLAQRIAKGPSPVDEALEVFSQIAEGLEAAHEKGVIHRDLKPANVKITPEGKVKILDFGLAKAFQEESAATDPSHSPTITEALTRAGVILGTAAYMSPEQARGKPVDRRADIWAFGAVLYEMLTGRRAFRGDDVSETLAAVITAEPDWDALGIGVPPSVHRLLRRCLQKDPRKRLSAIADARLEIEEALAPASTAEVAGKGAHSATWWRVLPWALAGILAIALISVYLIRQPSQPVSVPMHIPLVMSSDNSMEIYSPAISPDGSMIAFGASTSQGSSLYLRRLDEWEAHPLAGTQDGDSPFFSPDGQWIAFRRNGALEKISVSGGPSQVVCKDEGWQGRWLKDGRIVFGRWPQVGLWQVSSSGGAAQLIIKPPEVTEGSSLRYLDPQFLPDSRGILLTIWNQGQTSIAVLPNGADKPRILVESGSSPRYLPTGHLVYVASNRLFAVQFDLERSVLRGETIAVADDVNESLLSTSDYDVSSNGTLVFLPASVTTKNVVWKNRQGMTVGVVAASRQFEFPSLSPNGQRLSVVVREGPARNIWTARTSNEPLTRLTFGNDDWCGVFSLDGKRLFYLAGQAGKYNNFAISTDGSGKAERLTQSPHPQAPTSVSPAGDVVLYNDLDPSTGCDIWALSLQSGKTWPVVQTRYTEEGASFSPDGKWIAYDSNESGKSEVYVQAYPGPGLKKRISLEGGGDPFWSHSEREIFYQTTKALFVVPVLDSRDLRLGTPHLLFPLPKGGAYGFNIISADDQRFLMLEDSGLTVQLNLVQGWFEELKRLAPAK